MSIFNSDLKPEDVSALLKDVKKRLHFVGILGSGMYPLARLLAARGYRISGSDDNAPDVPYRDDSGISIIKERGSVGADAVIYSLAIAEENGDISYAKAHGIPLISRAQLLGALMSTYKIRISVSGSHGKSTTTALIDHILSVSGREHTTVSGAALSCGSAYFDRGGETFVAEACEYKDSFLRLCPTHQLITSVELDHTDYFESEDMLRASFLKAAESADVLIACADDPNALSIAKKVRDKGKRRVLTYGMREDSDYRISAVARQGDITRFSIFCGVREIRLSTSLIGDFNLLNIAAAVTLADVLDVDTMDIERAIESFSSIERRLTLIAKNGEVPIYYDYAHHPSEIRAVISALKERYGELTVIFRPHTYSRTKSLWQDFISALSKADFTILLDIYPAREKSIPDVSSQKLAEAINGAVCLEMSDAAKYALSRGSSAIALLGAGEVGEVKRELIEFCKKKGSVPERR